MIRNCPIIEQSLSFLTTPCSLHNPRNGLSLITADRRWNGYSNIPSRRGIENGANVANLAKLVHFQLSRVAHGDTLSTVAIRGAFAFASPRRRYLSTSFPHVAILALKSSDSFVVYLSTLSTIHICRPTSRRRASIRPVEHNSVGTPFPFSFFLLFFVFSPSLCLSLYLFSSRFFLSLSFLVLFASRSPRVRSINVYDVARSPARAIYVFRVIA